MGESNRKRKSQWDAKEDGYPPVINEIDAWRGQEQHLGNSGGKYYQDISASRSGHASKYEDSRYQPIERSQSRARDRSSSQSRGRASSRSPSRGRGRSRSRSRSRGRNWSENKIKSTSGNRDNARGQTRSRSPIRDSRRDSYGFNDGANRSGTLSQLCRAFAAGKCRRGSQCRFLHSGEDNLRNGDRQENDRVERQRNRPEHVRTSKSSNHEDPAVRSQDKVSDIYYEEGEPRRSRTGGTVTCRDFLKGNCRWGEGCRFSHHEASGDYHEKGTRVPSFNHDQERQSSKSRKPLCKYFAAGKCFRENCSFSHENPTSSNPEGKQFDDSVDHSFNSKNKDWTGPTWEDVARSSETPKPNGWGDGTAAEMSEGASLSGDRGGNGGWTHSSDSKNRGWTGPTWDDVARTSDTSVPTGLDTGTSKHGGWGDGAVAEMTEGASLSGDRGGNSGWINSFDGNNKGWTGPTWDDGARASDTSEPIGFGTDTSNPSGRSAGVSIEMENAGGISVNSSRNSARDQTSDSKKVRAGPKWEDAERGSEICKATGWGNGVAEASNANRSTADRSKNCGYDKSSDTKNPIWTGPTWDDAEIAQNISKATGWSNIAAAETINAGGVSVDTRHTGDRDRSADRNKIWNDPTWDDAERAPDISEPIGWGENAALVKKNAERFLLEGSSMSWSNNTVREGRTLENPEYKESTYEGVKTLSQPARIADSGKDDGMTASLDTRKMTSKQEHDVISNGPDSQKVDAIYMHAYKQNMILDTPVHHLTRMEAQHIRSANSLFQQHHMPVQGNVKNTSDSVPLVEMKRSEPAPDAVLIPRQRFNLNGDSIHSGPPLILNQTDQSEQILSSPSSNQHVINLNESRENMLPPLDLQQNYQTGTFRASETFAVSGDQVAEMTKPSAVASPSRSVVNDRLQSALHTGVENQQSPKPRYLETPVGSIAKENRTLVSDKFSQPKVSGQLKVKEDGGTKDDKEVRLFKNALIEFVKEILKPKWKEGWMTREVHKTIVKKAVDKVSSSVTGDHIPKTQEKIELYLSYSKPKITKLVEAYVERFRKTNS